jgi:hypothetical protein
MGLGTVNLFGALSGSPPKAGDYQPLPGIVQFAAREIAERAQS